MKNVLIVALLGVVCIGAQTPSRGSSYMGNTWVGLLVSGTCSPGSPSKAMQEADRTVGDRVTTPAVDAAGTRGSAEAGENLPATKGNVPQTGDLTIADRRKVKDTGWTKARQQASSLGSGCRVSADTKQFALMMPDGSAMPFDDVANGKIADQLRAVGGASATKILRVQVVGKLQNGKIALDEIQM